MKDESFDFVIGLNIFNIELLCVKKWKQEVRQEVWKWSLVW